MLSYQATLICNLLQGEESGARDTWNIYWRILEASHKGGEVQAKRKNSGLETTNEQEHFQTVRWKGQTHLSLPSQELLTPAGILSCFDAMKSPPQHRHYLNTRVSFLPKQHKEITSIYSVGYIGLFNLCLSPPDSDKNKENREVRILNAPMLAGFCGTRENVESLLFFLSYF